MNIKERHRNRYPRISIILLNYNGWPDAIECLESVYKITYPNWEVLLVDNGSVDGSESKIKEWAAGKIPVESKFFEYDAERKPIEYIEELLYDEETARVKVSKKEKEWDMVLPHQKLSILRIEKNCGFTGGNNIGIEYILKEKNTNYILLLSNDTVVDKDFLGELVKVAESDERIGIVGPKSYYYDFNGKKDVIHSAGAKIDMKRGSAPPIGVSEVDRGQHDELRQVDYIEGSCMLIKRDTIHNIGLLNTEYFLYWEETDWCVRAHKAGYKVLYVPKAKMWHKIASSSSSMTYMYYITKNRFLFMKQHATKKQFLSFLLYFFGFQFWFTSGIFVIYQRDINIFISFFRGVIDGLKTIHR